MTSKEPSSPTKLPLDKSIEQQEGESWTHWASKAATVKWFDEHPQFEEESVKTEKKVEDLIADIRAEFFATPSGIPERFVVELQTRYSDKNIVQATRRYHRFGYAVFWLFDKEAARKRRDAERALTEHMTETPSLGLISVEDGEFQLGYPITSEMLTAPSTNLTFNELYVPTYERTEQAYDHGDFIHSSGDQVSILSVDDEFCISRQVSSEGQRTLPIASSWTHQEITNAISEGELQRCGPVRGPP